VVCRVPPAQSQRERFRWLVGAIRERTLARRPESPMSRN
jgi:hypothetical protein